MSKVNVVENINKLNKEIGSTRLKFPKLDEIEIRDLIITKLLLDVKKPEKTESAFDETHEELLSMLDGSANFMRGMVMDANLSIAQREALTYRVSEIDELTETFNEAY